MARRAGCLGQSRRTHRGPKIRCRENAMLSVASCADRGVHLAPFHQLAMDALPIVLRNSSMAFAAGVGNVEVINRGFAIGRTENGVSRASAVRTAGGVAIAARGRHVQSTLRRPPVNAAFIELDRFFLEPFV